MSCVISSSVAACSCRVGNWARVLGLSDSRLRWEDGLLLPPVVDVPDLELGRVWRDDGAWCEERRPLAVD